MEFRKIYPNTQASLNHLTPVENPSQPHHLLYIEEISLLPSWIEALTVEQNPFRLNWRWTHATTLEMGLNLLQTQDFNLVVVNLFLPDSQGIETFDRLQATFPHLPIIINAATPEALNLARQCLQQGAIDYWRQPTQAAEIPLTQELFARTLYYLQTYQHLKQQLKQTEAQLREQQLFEQRLHATQNQMQRVVEAINDVVVILDATANNIQVFPTCLTLDDPIKTAILNHTLDLFTGETPSQVMLDEVRRSLLTQTTINVEYTFTLDCGQLWFRADISPFSETEVLWVGRDITATKQAEVKLRSSQQFLQLVMDNIPTHIFWKDRNGVYLGCNQNFATVAGLETPEEIIGKNDDDLPWTQAELENHRNSDRAVMESNQPEYHIVETQQTAAGKQVWLDTCKVPLHNPQGEVIGILGTYEDITQRRYIEERIKLTQFTLDQAKDKIFLVNSEGQFCYVNHAACRKLGYTHEQFLQRTINEIDPIFTPLVWQRHWQRLKQKRSLTRESIYITQLGKEFPVEVSINYFQYNQQEYNCVIARDISDRRIAEEKLQQQLAAIETAVDGIAILKDNHYIYLNPAHVKLFGYQRSEELIGKPWTCLYSAAEVERFQQDVFPVLLETQAWQGEAVATRKDGSIFGEEVSLSLTANGTLICVCRDITQRKQAETEIFKALETEQQLNQLKSRFITLMSHEFRTPLSVISSSAGILETFADQLSPEKKQKHLQKIMTQVQHTTELLNEILLIHQAETRQLTFNPQQLDVINFCQTLVQEIKLNHGYSHQIRLDYHQHHRSLIATVDRTLLRYILTELLSNAIKFSSNHSLINLSITCSEEQICFQVKDQGIGISSVDLHQIFESFYRAQNVGTIQGAGLGLSIVKKCVDLHHGEITIISELNQGTTFTVRLPLSFEEKV